LTVALSFGGAADGGRRRRSLDPRGKGAGGGKEGESLVCRSLPAKNQHWKQIPRHLVYAEESREAASSQAGDDENGKPGFPGIAGQEKGECDSKKPCNKNDRRGGNVLILPITPGGYPDEEKRDGPKENKAKRDLPGK